MKRVDFEMATTGGLVGHPAYVSDHSDEFCAHRSSGDDGWLVSHRRTGMAIPRTGVATRREALELARSLSRTCPSAKNIDRGKKLGTTSGPVRKLASEVKTAMGLA